MASSSVATRSRMGTRHSVARGFSTVATRRRPSALAESDEYCSTPMLARRQIPVLTSIIQIHRPMPSQSWAQNRTMLGSIGVGYLTSRIPKVSCCRPLPSARRRQRSISFVMGRPRTT